MATRSVDIKLRFDQFDCKPGRIEWEKFRRNLLTHGGETDDAGWSIADTFLRQDAGAVNAAGALIGPPLPGGAGAANAAARRRRRLKMSYLFLMQHLSNEDEKRALAGAAYFQNGPDALDYLETKCNMAMDTQDTWDTQEKWRGVTIAKDVGFSEESIHLLDTKLQTINSDLAIPFGNDDIVEKILREIARASRALMVEANKELNAVEGVPGQPGVRQFQAAVPGIGLPRPRNKAMMIVHFHGLWRNAFRSGVITAAPPTKSNPGPSRAGVERGLAARGTLTSVQPPPAGSTSPHRTLPLLAEAGFLVRRGVTTTSDFSGASSFELQQALSMETFEGEVDEDGYECEPCFSIEHVFDADGQEAVELICTGCLGIGHIKRVCPSPNKFRTYDYGIKLLTNAKTRAEQNAAARGDGAGGRRPPPRGMRSPFRKGLPRRFQQASQPMRRFQPPGHKAHLAETEEESEPEPEPDRRSETGSSAREASSPSVPPAPERPPEASTGASALAAREESNAEVRMPTLFRDAEFFTEKGRSAVERMPFPPGLDSTQPGPPSVHVPSVREKTTVEERATPTRGLATRHYLLAILIACGAALVGYADEIALSLRSWSVTCSTAAWRLAHSAAGMFVSINVVLLMLVICGRRANALPLAPTAASPELGLTHGTGARLGGSGAFDVIEKALRIEDHQLELRRTDAALGLDETMLNATETEDDASNTPTPVVLDLHTHLVFTVDSGATIVCVSEHDEWILHPPHGEVTDRFPKIGVEVASGTLLPVKTVGRVNRNGKDRVGNLAVDAWELLSDGSWKMAGRRYPTLGRVCVVKGLKMGTRLAGVRPLKEDGIFTYFNDDNRAKLDECCRLSDGTYVRFLSDPKYYDLGLIIEEPLRDTALVARDARRTGIEVHASLMHAYDGTVRSSNIHITGFDVTKLYVDSSECLGCRLGKTHAPPHRKSTAPSRGGVRAPYGSKVATREPSTVGYDFFGQRVDSDMTVRMPKSWPHGFTAAIDFCDRHTAEVFFYFLTGATSSEVGGACNEFVRRVKPRLKDEKVWRWHVDNDLAFEGPDVEGFAAEMVANVTSRVPHDANTNPIAERYLGTGKEAILSAIAFAGADKSLWPWALSQYESVRYFLNSAAHSPPTSPFSFSNPGGGPADMSWAKPLFCDVTVHLSSRDQDGKLAYTGEDGCYLGHDFKRNCEFVYVPKLQRLSSFTVTDWRPLEFSICKGITPDTPVEYRDPSDLRFSPVSGALIPKRLSVRRAGAHAAEERAPAKEGGIPKEEQVEDDPRVENAARIQRGLWALEKEGVRTFSNAAVAEMRRELVLEAVTREAEFDGAALQTEMLVCLYGSETAKAVVQATSIVHLATVQEAMDSQWWPMIKEAMESEIAGKVANGFARVVKWEPGMRVMKVKWVIDVALNQDGSIKRIKTRLVGCGYSQVAGADFDEVYAHTLPGPSLRVFCSIVADEDLETDQLDAVKAFTQADVDRVLYCDMPEGFKILGHVLLLLKALEGIKQGAALWFKKNKWAWNKCNMFSDMAEPNLYTHSTLNIIAAVFADDTGTGFHHSVRAEYLAMRGEYAKLINIDSPGPDIVRPLSIFVGCELTRDRQMRTVKVTQRGYINKLKARYKTRYTLNDLPYGGSKIKRDEFDKMTKTDGEGTPEAKAEFLNLMGSIGWPTGMTKPECSYAYSVLASFSQNPQAVHINAALHVIGYIVKFEDLGPIYGGKLRIPLGLDAMPEWFHESRGLYASADSSWGKTARPYGGHAVFRMNAAFIWKSSSFKTTVPGSTAEAETAEASRATKSVMFSRVLLEGVRRVVRGATMLLGDNSAMMDLVKKDGTTARTRYFERATMLVKFAVMKLLVATRLVPTAKMVADIFTKAVDKETFYTMRAELLNLHADVNARAALGKVSRLFDSIRGALDRW